MNVCTVSVSRWDHWVIAINMFSFSVALTSNDVIPSGDRILWLQYLQYLQEYTSIHFVQLLYLSWWPVITNHLSTFTFSSIMDAGYYSIGECNNSYTRYCTYSFLHEVYCVPPHSTIQLMWYQCFYTQMLYCPHQIIQPTIIIPNTWCLLLNTSSLIVI